MTQHTETLQSIRWIIKYYERFMKEIGETFGLSQIEINILSFLHYNPGKDTARDIVELRMLPKGNVSQGVERLIQKSLLARQGDLADRRKIHLFLTEETREILVQIDKSRKIFEKEVYQGFSKEEKEMYDHFAKRIFINISQGMKKFDGEAEK